MSVRGAELVMILPGAADDTGQATPAVRLGEALAAASARSGSLPAGGGRLTCGLSDTAEDLDRLPRSLQEAEHAVEIGTRIGRSGQVISYGELGIYSPTRSSAPSSGTTPPTSSVWCGPCRCS